MSLGISLRIFYEESMRVSKLSQERLKEVLNYDPATGLFRWAIATSARVRLGSIAGATRERGYIMISIDGERFRAHRLAWLYVHGEWPDGLIDHVNRVTYDNRIANLRVVTHRQNTENRLCNNKLNYPGVDYRPGWERPYRARISNGGKTTVIGSFLTPEEAHEAYIRVKKERHTFSDLTEQDSSVRT